MPSRSMISLIRSGWPRARTPGSVTSITRPTPSRLSSQPASSAAPGPNLIGVASRVKTVSCSDAAIRLSLLLRVGYGRPRRRRARRRPAAGKVAGSMPHATGSLLEALSDAVGPAHVLADPEVTASYATDWTGRFTGRARLVARP